MGPHTGSHLSLSHHAHDGRNLPGCPTLSRVVLLGQQNQSPSLSQHIQHRLHPHHSIHIQLVPQALHQGNPHRNHRNRSRSYWKVRS